ncbi:MAG: hypothetical protein AAGJ52_06065 [Pseudomonadota bacterium]
MNEISIIRLAKLITEGDLRELNQAEVSAVLGWVTRSKADEHRKALEKALGKAEDQPELALNALNLLERSLFFDDLFQQSKAGVSSQFDRDERRRRYRLLLSAFHPDRLSDEIDWMTQRSQLIIRAYQDFKRNPDGVEESRPGDSSSDSSARRARTGSTNQGPIKHNESELTIFLRERFGNDRWLGHKVIAVMAVLLLLPLISVLLDGQPDATPIVTNTPTAPAESAPAEPRAREPIERLSAATARQDASTPIQADDLLLPIAETPAEATDEPETAAPASTTSTTASTEPVDLPSDEPVDREVALASSPPSSASPAITEAPVPTRDEPVPGTDPTSNPVVANEQTEAAAASVPAELASQDDERRNSSRRAAELTSGALALGPVAQHRVGDLLTAYQAAVESGDLAALTALLADQPRRNGRVDPAWFQAHYGGLFDTPQARQLSLRVISARRMGNNWRVEVDHDLALLDQRDGRRLQQNQRIEFQFSPSPFALKISGMNF